MNLKINESAFLSKLSNKSAQRGPTLKQYVLVNLEFLQNCRQIGHTLTDLAEVISDELGRKVYPSNLGRLLKRHHSPSMDEKCPTTSRTMSKAVQTSEHTSDNFEDVFEVKPTAVSSPSQSGKDPLGIGGLM